MYRIVVHSSHLSSTSEHGRLDVKGKSYESGWKDDDPSQTCNFRTVERKSIPGAYVHSKN
jgi:hypothetical protein